MLRPDGRKRRCDAFGAAVEKWVVLVCGRQSLTGLVSVRYEPSLRSLLFKILLKQHTHIHACAHMLLYKGAWAQEHCIQQRSLCHVRLTQTHSAS